jgi:hypothetical protein
MEAFEDPQITLNICKMSGEKHVDLLFPISEICNYFPIEVQPTEQDNKCRLVISPRGLGFSKRYAMTSRMVDKVDGCVKLNDIILLLENSAWKYRIRNWRDQVMTAICSDGHEDY